MKLRGFLRHLELILKANQLCQEANTLDAKGYFLDALGKYNEAEKLFSKLSDSEGEITCLNNKGLILETIEDYPRAISNFKLALNIAKENEDHLTRALQLGNIGRILKKEAKFNEALQYLHESFNILSNLHLEEDFSHLSTKILFDIKHIERIFHEFK